MAISQRADQAPGRCRAREETPARPWLPVIELGYLLRKLPQPHDRVLATGQEPATVPRTGQGPHFTHMVLEAAKLPAGFHVPQPNYPIRRGGEKAAVVGAVCHRADGAVVRI